MEREWIQIEEENGNKNGYLYWVFGSSQGMEMKDNHWFQAMDFVTWVGENVTNWENSLPSSNGKGLMRGWNKKEERQLIIY